MKRKKSNMIYLTAFMLLLTIIAALYVPGAKAGDATDDIALTAGIYNDANRTDIKTELTADGAMLEGWEYISASNISSEKYLGINVSNIPLDGSQYQVVVEMSPYIYINSNSDPTVDKTTLTYTKNDAITVNTTGSYSPHKYSLSNLTYTIDQNVTNLSFGLPLQFDVNLWSKQNGAEIGRDGKPLLNVYIQKKEGSTTTAIDSSRKSLKQATASGSETFEARKGMYITGAGATGNETINMGANDQLRFMYSHYSDTAYNAGLYVDNIKIEMVMPSYKDANGTTHYVKYSDFKFTVNTGTPTYEESYDEDTGTLTITAEDIYFNNYKTFELLYSAPDALKTIPGNYVLTGKVSTVIDGVYAGKNLPITINLDTNTEAIIKGRSSNGSANIFENDTVQGFGALVIQNDAAYENGTGKLLLDLEFDTNDTKAVSVTTVNLACDRDTKTIDIYYSLVDREGNLAYPDPETGENQVFTTTIDNKHYSPGGAISTNHYITYSRSKLPIEEHKQYYFDTFSYTMGNLPGNTKAYHSGAINAPYSAGTIWGYVNVNTVPETKPKHSLKVYTVNSEGEKVKEVVSIATTTNINQGTSVPYGMENGTTSVTTVAPGGSAILSGRVYVPSYPYTSNSCLNDIILGFVLPAGVTIKASDVTATYTGGTLPVKTITVKEISASQNLYVIEFEQGEKIGYFNEQLVALQNGSTLTYSVKLNSEKVMATQTMSIRDCVFVAGNKRSNGTGGSYADTLAVDTYDLNNNGSTTDKVGQFNKNTTATITFQANTEAIVITDTLVKGGESAKEQNLDTFAETLEYNLDIECAQTGTAKDFYWIVPISKKSMTSESDFVTTCQADVKLKGEVSITNHKGTGMKVLYAVDPAASYNEAASITQWYETLPDDKTWDDVTFIKVVAIEEQIESGSHNVLHIPLGYAGQDIDFMNEDGKQISFKSKGFYSYVLGSNSNSGVQATKGCVMTLNYEQEPIYITLTAAKDGTPKEDGAVSSYTLTLPEFAKERDFTIKEITESNLTLVDAGFDLSSLDSTKSNETFRISADVNPGDNALQAIHGDSVSIGSVSANSSADITFAIENADILTEVVTERKASMILVGTDGTLIPVFITVNRELTPAEPTKSAITSGKVYMPFEGTKATTTSNNSSFTAQFITNYVPANYKDRTLCFEQPLVKDTAITMVDWTNPNDLGYYVYYCDGNSDEISLADFIHIYDKTAYKAPEDKVSIAETLLFVVDFPTGGESNKTNKIDLNKTIKTGSTSSELPQLSFTTVEQRMFDLSASKNKASFGEEIDVTYSSECSLADSRYAGRSLSLIIEPANGSNLPSDINIIADGKIYPLTSQGSFIVPLTPAHEEGKTLALAVLSNTLTEANFDLSLWASDTDDAERPLMGTKVAEIKGISISNAEKPSFEVTAMEKRILHPADLKSKVSVEYEVKDEDTITVEAQKKIGDAYITQTDILESINGSNDLISAGVFTVNSSSSTNIKINESAAAGTYRLLFKISNSGSQIDVPYNFIITDKQ